MKSLDDICGEVRQALIELVKVAHLQAGQIVVIGCSTSEVAGQKIGSASNLDIGQMLVNEIVALAGEREIRLAFQCCEHLNRALVIEASTLTNETVCNVVPQPHAGGAMATFAYRKFTHPVVVEYIKADAGLDIGDTFIGMHLKHVAVPVRLAVKEIGCAHVTAARVRPKFIGGIRAVYDEELI